MKTLAKSLAKFHELMGTVEKSESNPFFKSKYASLETILPAIKKPLADAGLTFVQMPSMALIETVATPTLVTSIIDVESGEEFTSETPLLLTKQDAQGHGSAITYMRRYMLVSMLGLNCDVDDDGNKASGNKVPKEKSSDYVEALGF
jgi:hypothetical protein